MAAPLRTVLNDIRHGENVDLYLTILLSLVVAVLGVVGTVRLEILGAAILATLSLLGSSTLANRKASTEIAGSFRSLEERVTSIRQHLDKPARASDVLTDDYPDLSAYLLNARRVRISGAILVDIVHGYLSELGSILKHGGQVRFLVTEPTGAVLEMQVLRSSSVKDPSAMLKTIKGNLCILQSLSSKAQAPDQFACRMIPYLGSLNYIIIEEISGISRVFAKALPFRRPDSESPCFQVTSQQDPHWHQFFCDQFDQLWSASRPMTDADAA